MLTVGRLSKDVRYGRKRPSPLLSRSGKDGPIPTVAINAFGGVPSGRARLSTRSSRCMTLAGM